MKDHNSGTFCMDIIFTNHYKVGVAMPRKTFVQITNENCYTVPLVNAYVALLPGASTYWTMATQHNHATQ